jgi:signal recognition particle receptor subunit beta
VLIHYAAREIHAKIVYYGPGLSGKTTNLQFIHGRLPEHARGRMVSLATDGDRTLFFDFLPFHMGLVHGFKVRFHLYTVPGQTHYAATRRVILRGVDGVVFVADSQAFRLAENQESFADLERNLRLEHLDRSRLPLIVQWNKRDCPTALPIPTLAAEIPVGDLPTFEAVASRGLGVADTLKACCRLVLRAIEARRPAAATAAASAAAPAVAPTAAKSLP